MILKSLEDVSKIMSILNLPATEGTHDESLFLYLFRGGLSNFIV